MPMAEDIIKKQGSSTPAQYQKRVRWLALIYFTLNILSILIMIIIAWRVQFFITITQRSNVETLTLAIVFILALYYVVSTFRGFIGAIRIALMSLPGLWSRDKEKIERRKHDAIDFSKESKSAFLDQAVALEGKPNEPIKWEVADSIGKLGEIALEGVKITYYPIKDGMDNSIFEFVAEQVEKALKKRDLEAKLVITQWSTIDDDEASSYYSMVQAFQNLETQLGKGRIWPTVEITQEDIDDIQQSLRELVPSLRNEAFLPDVEYQVEYQVPVLPEPLGFVQLTRNESRADPVITMGCAVFVMLVVMLIIVLFIVLPPWLPSK